MGLRYNRRRYPRNYNVSVSVTDSVNYNNLNPTDKSHIDRNLNLIQDVLSETINTYIILRTRTRSISNIAESLYETLRDNHKKFCKNDPVALIRQRNDELAVATTEKTNAETAAATATKAQNDAAAAVPTAEAAVAAAALPPALLAAQATLKAARETLEKANKAKDAADKQLITANANFTEKTNNKNLADQHDGCIDNFMFTKESIEKLILKFDYEYTNNRSNFIHLRGGGYIKDMINDLASNSNYTPKQCKLIDILYYLDKIDRSQLINHQNLILSLFK
jgi:hypothetical protein